MIFPWNLFMGPIPSVYWLSRFLILSVFMVQQGCTGPSVPALQWGPWEPHVTEEVRAKIQTIEVAVAEKLPRVTIELPSKGPASGAGRKARKWSGNWVWAAGGAFAASEKGGG